MAQKGQVSEAVGENSHSSQQKDTVIFDSQCSFTNKCTICHLGEKLINPCRCAFNYHQRCLLKYVQGKLCAMDSQPDLSGVKCPHCGEIIRYEFKWSVEYSWRCFVEGLSRKIWSGWFFCIVGLIMVIVIIAAFIGERFGVRNELIFLVMIGVEVILVVVCLAMITVFLKRCLMYTKIQLIRVYTYIEAIENQEGNDSPVFADNVKIVVM